MRNSIFRIVTAWLIGISTISHADPKHGGTLTMLVEPEPPAIVGIANTSGPTGKVTAKTNEGLLAYDFNLKPIPPTRDLVANLG
jgi:hypothetical protein